MSKCNVFAKKSSAKYLSKMHSWSLSQMFQRKTRRKSVILDMHGRIKALLDLAHNIKNGDIKPSPLIDKMTLIDYLNITKIVLGKFSKTDNLKLEFNKLMYDSAIQYSEIVDADEIYDLDRAIWNRSDIYIRSVGHFSSFMSKDELWGRVKSLNSSISKSTHDLISCIHSYAETFYDVQENNNSIKNVDNPYIDAINDLNSDICLLSFLDHSKMIKKLSEINQSEIIRLNTALQTFLPKVSVDLETTKPSQFKIWKERFSAKDNQRNKKHASGIVNIVDKYLDICGELHVDKHYRYVHQTLPSKSSILPILENKIVDKFPSLHSYVDDKDDKTTHFRETYESFIALTTAIIDAVAVLAAFRTMLLSKELEALRHDATNSLLDVPDKADLEAFLSQIQPANL